MSKAYWINSQIQRVIEIDCNGLDDMNRIVNNICVVKRWSNGDTLYVDDNGLLKPQEHFFGLRDYPQPLAGDGIVVGAEVETEDGWYNKDVSISLADMQLVWLGKDFVKQWVAMNADTPAVTINNQVIQTYGELMRTALGEN